MPRVLSAPLSRARAALDILIGWQGGAPTAGLSCTPPLPGHSSGTTPSLAPDAVASHTLASAAQLPVLRRSLRRRSRPCPTCAGRRESRGRRRPFRHPHLPLLLLPPPLQPPLTTPAAAAAVPALRPAPPPPTPPTAATAPALRPAPPLPTPPAAATAPALGQAPPLRTPPVAAAAPALRQAPPLPSPYASTAAPARAEDCGGPHPCLPLLLPPQPLHCGRPHPCLPLLLPRPPLHCCGPHTCPPLRLLPPPCTCGRLRPAPPLPIPAAPGVALPFQHEASERMHKDKNSFQDRTILCPCPHVSSISHIHQLIHKTAHLFVIDRYPRGRAHCIQ